MTDQSPQHSNSGIVPILFVFFAWAAIIAGSLAAYRPVMPLTDDAPADQFSAARADKILNSLVGDSVPHPAGSPQNAIVRARIVSWLESFGYVVDVQTGTGRVWDSAKDRSPDKDEVELHNIIARRTGESSGPAILLVSHYDSVPFGPGASDDGVGTAALLEIARMLASETEPRREVIFLITDGEEFGLLGAELFVSENPLASHVGLAINLEARGTTGPSLMFETSRLSRTLVPVFSRAARHPMASSLFVEIYKRLPNDTDFTLLKRAGILGYNFAFIGDVKNYHTTADNYENVDQGSLQHHGENALGLIRELLAGEELDEIFKDRSSSDPSAVPIQDEAVYFDLFGRWIIWWPSLWSVGLGAIAGVLFLISMIKFKPANIGHRQPEFRSRVVSFVVHLGFQLLVILSISGAGYLIQKLVQQDPRMSNPWPLQPIPILIGYWFASFAIVGGLSISFSRWLEPKATWSTFCLLWLVLAAASSLQLNGASYLFVVPMLLTTFFACVACWFGEKGLVASVVFASITVGLIWLPLERLFYDAVGFRMPVATLVRMALLGTPLLGVMSIAKLRIRFGFAIITSVISVLAFAAAIALNSEF